MSAYAEYYYWVIKQNVLSTSGLIGLFNVHHHYAPGILDYILCCNTILKVKLVIQVMGSNVRGSHLDASFQNSCHRLRPPRPRLDTLPPTSRLKACPAFPLLANLTAFRIFSSVSSARGSFPIFL